MSAFSSRQMSYPHHWPVHGRETHAPGTRHTAAAAGETLPATSQPSYGELTASPWLGLHYETEGA